MINSNHFRFAASAAVLMLAFGCARNDAEQPPSASAQNSEGASKAEAPAAAQPEAANETAMPAHDMMASLRAECPVALNDASVQATDTDKGVALTFQTDGTDVDALRQRVAHMKDMYQSNGGHHSMMWHAMGGPNGHHGMMNGNGTGQGMMNGTGQGMMGQGMMGGMHAAGMMPAVNCTLQDTDKGARLEMVPRNSADLTSLREHVRLHAQHMQAGECPMLGTEQAPSGDTQKEK